MTNGLYHSSYICLPYTSRSIFDQVKVMVWFRDGSVSREAQTFYIHAFSALRRCCSQDFLHSPAQLTAKSLMNFNNYNSSLEKHSGLFLSVVLLSFLFFTSLTNELYFEGGHMLQTKSLLKAVNTSFNSRLGFIYNRNKIMMWSEIHIHLWQISCTKTI